MHRPIAIVVAALVLAGCGSTAAPPLTTASPPTTTATTATATHPASTSRQWASIIAASDLHEDLPLIGDCWGASDISCALLPFGIELEALTLVRKLTDSPLGEPPAEVEALVASTRTAAKQLKAAAHQADKACPGSRCDTEWVRLDMAGMQMADELDAWQPWL